MGVGWAASSIGLHRTDLLGLAVTSPGHQEEGRDEPRTGTGNTSNTAGSWIDGGGALPEMTLFVWILSFHCVSLHTTPLAGLAQPSSSAADVGFPVNRDSGSPPRLWHGLDFPFCI